MRSFYKLRRARAALGLKNRGYCKASEYLEKHAELLVSFAELALEGIRIPYTTNRVERRARVHQLVMPSSSGEIQARAQSARARAVIHN